MARSALAAGIGYPQLLRLIIKAAFEGPPFDPLVPMLGASSAGRSSATSYARS
jgi:hypothetical protein